MNFSKSNQIQLCAAKILTVFFLVIIYSNLALTVSGVEFFEEFHENRRLGDLPSVNLNSISYKSITSLASGLKSYINDHFAFRKPLIMFYNSFTWYLFETSSSPIAMQGKDGWIFYGLKNLINDYERKETLYVEYINKIESSIANRQAWLAEKGIPFIFLIIPNKHNIYSQYMPDYLQRGSGPSNGELLMQQVLKKFPDVGVNIFDDLRKESNNNQFYYKIDTHWNHNGALLAVQEVLIQLKTFYPKIQYRELPVMDIKHDTFSPGNFGRVMGVPLKEIERKSIPENGWASKSKPTPELETFLPERAKIKRHFNPEAPPSCILVFGDSYSGAGQFNFYLAESFRDTVLLNLWATAQMPANRLPTKLIEHLKPDLVLFMIAERRLGDYPEKEYYYSGNDPELLTQ